MLLRCISAENRKLRHSVIWLVFLAVPLLSAGYGTFNFLQNQDILKLEWTSLWSQHTLFYALLFFAPLVAVYAAYLWRLEHLGHNWNLIMTAPVPPFQLFLAKFVVVTKMALLTQGWVLVLFVLCGKLWAHIPGWPPLEMVFWLARGAFGGLAVIALQLLLSMLIRSFALPVLIALGGSIAGLVAVNQNVCLFWPYALMILGMNSNKAEDVLTGGIGSFLVSCALFTIVFFLIAAFMLRTKDVNT